MKSFKTIYFVVFLFISFFGNTRAMAIAGNSNFENEAQPGTCSATTLIFSCLEENEHTDCRSLPYSVTVKPFLAKGLRKKALPAGAYMFPPSNDNPPSYVWLEIVKINRRFLPFVWISSQAHLHLYQLF